jgi:hypothetical protein
LAALRQTKAVRLEREAGPTSRTSSGAAQADTRNENAREVTPVSPCPQKTRACIAASPCLVWLRGKDLNLRPSGYEAVKYDSWSL